MLKLIVKGSCRWFLFIVYSSPDHSYITNRVAVSCRDVSPVSVGFQASACRLSSESETLRYAGKMVRSDVDCSWFPEINLTSLMWSVSGPPRRDGGCGGEAVFSPAAHRIPSFQAGVEFRTGVLAPLSNRSTRSFTSNSMRVGAGQRTLTRRQNSFYFLARDKCIQQTEAFTNTVFPP